MAGQVRNPDNAAIWVDANVWGSAAATRPALPATIDSPMPAGWDLPWGILDGKAGMADDRKWKEAEQYGWNIGLIKVTHSEFGMNRSVTALEDNASTRAMLWPGSTDTSVVVPRPVSLWLAFETTSDLGKGERLFTTMKSQITCEKTTRSEADITSMPFVCKIFASSTGELFTRQAALTSYIVTISAATAGTWTLTYGGQTTTALAFGVTNIAVQSALVALSSIGAGNATVTGSVGGPFTVTMALGMTGTLTGSGAALTPAGTVIVT